MAALSIQIHILKIISKGSSYSALILVEEYLSLEVCSQYLLLMSC